MRDTETKQNQIMVPPKVQKALEEFHNNNNDPNYDATRDPDYEKRRAILFMNNDLINRAGLLGVIDNDIYQSAQKDYADLNAGFGKRAAISADAEFREQQRDPEKKFDPGTDSDYITEVTSPGQIKEIQQHYNDDVNVWLHEQGVLDKPRNDWHNKLDTDFMADPNLVSKEDFEKIAELNNAAYQRQKAAHYEALSRMTPEQLRAAGYKDGKIPLELSTAFVNEMEQMGNQYGDKVRDILNDPKKREQLKNDPNARADLQIYQALEQKYNKRKQEATQRLVEQQGLEGPNTPGRPEITNEDRKFTEGLAKKRKEDALAQGKSQEEADEIERNVLKSLEQNQIPVEKPLSGLPREASKRSKKNKAKSQAASAISQHLSNQATKGYTDTLAEMAGKDSSIEQKTQEDIAEKTKNFSDSKKAEVVESSRQQYERGMKNELLKTLDPETAGKIAAEKGREYEKGLTRAMRNQARKSGSTSPDVETSEKGKTKVKGAIQGGPRDVAVFSEKARIKPIDNRKTKKSTSNLDESNVIAAAEAAFATGKEIANAGVASLNQKRELQKREEALARNDFNAALRHQKKAAEYGAKAQQALGNAVKEGLNGIPLDKLPGLEGNEEVKKAIALGTYTKSAFQTGQKYGESFVSLSKAENYENAAKEAEARGEKKIATKYRQLAANSQIDAADKGIGALRATPVIGTGYKLGEAWVLDDQAEEYRQRAKKALEKGDIGIAQEFYKRADELEKQKSKNINGALDNIPLLGQTAKKYEALGENFAKVYQKLDQSDEYRARAEEMRNKKDFRMAEKFEALAGKAQKEAHDKLTKVIQSTPVAGSTQHLGQATIAMKYAKREWELAEQARLKGDSEAEARHRNQALIQEKKAKDNFDKFKENAPKELAAILAAAGSGYAPHILVLAAAYKGTRGVIEYTEKGKRFETAKTEGMAGLLSKAEDAKRRFQGEKTREEIADESLSRAQKAWLRKLDNGEIRLKEGMTRDDFINALDASKSGNRKIASLSNLGDLDAYVEVMPQPGNEKQKTFDRGDSSIPTLNHGSQEDPEQIAKLPPPGSDSETDFMEPESSEDQSGILLPSVVGLGLEEAAALIQTAGLHPVMELGEETSDPGKVDTIATQSPTAGDRVEVGGEVLLSVYSEAVAAGNVPNVIGMGLEKAVASIEGAGLVPVIEVGDETSDPNKVDTIAWQGPSAGDEVEEGSEVTLSVYTQGVEGRIVPDLTHMKLARAKKLLESRDLFIEPVQEKAAPKQSDENKVYKQYPEPGLEVPNGIGIRAWAYSKFKEPEDGWGGFKKGGVPFIDLPDQLLFAPIRNVRVCDGVNKMIETNERRRIMRPRTGFLCSDSGIRTADFYNGQGFVTLYWAEPGDRMKPNFTRFCDAKKEGPHYVETYIAEFHTMSEVKIKSNKTQAHLRIRLDKKDAKSSKGIQEAFRLAKKLMANIEPYAQKCSGGSQRKHSTSSSRRGQKAPRNNTLNIPNDPCAYILGMPNPSPECRK